MGNLGNSEDPDKMQHNAAFHQGLHCLLKLEQPSGTEKHHSIENATCDPLKCTMGSHILIVSICKAKSNRIQRVIKDHIHCVTVQTTLCKCVLEENPKVFFLKRASPGCFIPKNRSRFFMVMVMLEAGP